MNEEILNATAISAVTLGILFTIACSVLIWTFKNQIKRIDNIEFENKEIKENYLHRFDELKSLINKHNTSMHVELSQFKVDIALIKQKIGIAN